MSRRAELTVNLLAHSCYDGPLDGETGDPILPSVYGVNTVDGYSCVKGMIQVIPEFAGRSCYQSFDRPNEKTRTNQGYLANILRQRHFSVLEHSSVSFYITGVSRALTHELVRHRHFSPSQLSQRYVPIEELKIVVHPMIRDALTEMAQEDAKNNPLGVTAEEMIETYLDGYAENAAKSAIWEYENAMEFLKTYFPGAKRKQLQEAARMKLPNEVETRIVVTGNFRTWMEFLLKRDSEAADREIQDLAYVIGGRMAGIAPNIFGGEARALWDPTHSQEAPK